MPPKPTSAFPALAAPLPGEADLLAAVVADLCDDTAKLVYADWLEEHDDPRGPYLRKALVAARAGKKFDTPKFAPESWRDLVGLTLLQKIHAAKLTKHTDKFLRLARPTVAFKATKTADAKLAIGTSKFGGCPDLPADWDWPVWDRGTLAFLGQFNLADLSASVVTRELPREGILSVFYDTEGNVFDTADVGGWCVLHFPDASELKRREYPEELPEQARFKSCRLSFFEQLMLPTADSPWEKELDIGDDNDSYWDVMQDSGVTHHLLGYAHPIQNDVHGQKSVRHLLTIDSDYAPNWMWGDAGLLYFMIAEKDLQKHHFDRTRFEMQCG